METPLVVGVDGSGPSLTAVDWAVDEAARHGLPLRLVYGSLWERYEGALPSAGRERSAEEVMAQNVVGTATERARRRDPDVKVSATILPDDPVSVLLEAGDSAFALVIGSRGRGELKGLLLGSVSLAVAARARCPVFVVRGDAAGLAGSHERILLGAGESGTCDEAVRFAFREAESRGCVLDVVRAWRRRTNETAGSPVVDDDSDHGDEDRTAALLDELLRDATAGHPTVRVRGATVEGPAHRVLVHRSAAADLVIVGARRRAGSFGIQLGRTSHALLHHAQCPVAVVPQRV
ncbi:universal stress protein [Streptomyces sp. NPDC003393]